MLHVFPLCLHPAPTTEAAAQDPRFENQVLGHLHERAVLHEAQGVTDVFVEIAGLVIEAVCAGNEDSCHLVRVAWPVLRSEPRPSDFSFILRLTKTKDLTHPNSASGTPGINILLGLTAVVPT